MKRPYERPPTPTLSTYMADAAVEILTRPAAEVNGQCFIDSDVLIDAGVTDLSPYGGGDDPMWDIFLDKS